MKRPLKYFHYFIKGYENIFNGKFHETNKIKQSYTNEKPEKVCDASMLKTTKIKILLKNNYERC